MILKIHEPKALNATISNSHNVFSNTPPHAGAYKSNQGFMNQTGPTGSTSWIGNWPCLRFDRPPRTTSPKEQPKNRKNWIEPAWTGGIDEPEIVLKNRPSVFSLFLLLYQFLQPFVSLFFHFTNSETLSLFFPCYLHPPSSTSSPFYGPTLLLVLLRRPPSSDDA